jgi:type IV pilus assembly protein PilA
MDKHTSSMATSALHPQLKKALMLQPGQLSHYKKNALQQGFTLVELMIVIVIVGILSAVALPNFLAQTKKAAATEGTEQASSIAKQAATYYLEQGALGTVDATCAKYAGTIDTTNRKFTYACSGTDTAFQVKATGKDTDNNTKGVTVTVTANLTDGTQSKPVVAGT